MDEWLGRWRDRLQRQCSPCHSSLSLSPSSGIQGGLNDLSDLKETLKSYKPNALDLSGLSLSIYEIVRTRPARLDSRLPRISR